MSRVYTSRLQFRYSYFHKMYLIDILSSLSLFWQVLIFEKAGEGSMGHVLTFFFVFSEIFLNKFTRLPCLVCTVVI